MASTIIPASPQVLESEWHLPDRGFVGVFCLIATESALFIIFVVAYLYYIGKSLNGPYPKDVLTLPIVSTICLLSSSITIVLAEHALEKRAIGGFRLWWTATIALAIEFLTTTGLEWRHLIKDEHLTIATNLFGTTFYSLVGLHATHVVVGLIFLLTTLIVSLAGFPIYTQARRVKMLSWYWHFVDAVWIVVFTVVYVIGR
jgi:cytochrome c oxidase subunit 3/cytochrome o ubiquinol oxidase subunit 3